MQYGLIKKTNNYNTCNILGSLTCAAEGSSLLVCDNVSLGSGTAWNFKKHVLLSFTSWEQLT